MRIVLDMNLAASVERALGWLATPPGNLQPTWRCILSVAGVSS